MTVDMEKCKRIVQYFWDPEPRNEDPKTVIWCLGREYAPTADVNVANDTGNDTWPKAFISDFGSRVWITYRSNFTPIPRTKTPEATSSMTLGVRLRSQLMDSQGFTSDTGWGCMIRSGQALLANTLSILLLGRGESCPTAQLCARPKLMTQHQIGGAGKKQRRNRNCYHYLLIIQMPHSRSIDSLIVGQIHVASTLANGLDHPQRPSVSSEYHTRTPRPLLRTKQAALNTRWVCSPAGLRDE